MSESAVLSSFKVYGMDGRTDQPTDRRTDRTFYRDARTHLKMAQGIVTYTKTNVI